MRARGAMTLAAGLTVLLSMTALPASATDPVELGTGYVFDDVDALTPAEEAQAEAREWLEDENDHFSSEINVQSLVKGIDHISYPDGGVSVGLTVDEVRELHETLPANQWQQLTTAFENLIFDEHVARSAVDEPGFSQGS